MSEPEPAAGPPIARPGVGGTLRAAFQLIREHPRETLLPFAVIQIPLVVATIVATIVLYNTAFSDEIYPRGGLFGVDEAGGQLFALALVAGIVVLFSLVGWSATIIATAGIASGESVSLSEALDPAFTRLGGLVGLTLLILGGTVLLAASVVGVVALPYLAIRLGVAFQVYLLEDVGPIESLRRSWQIMKGNMLRLFGVVLVVSGIALLIGLLLSANPDPENASRSTRMTIDAVLQVVQGAFAIPAAVFAHAATTIYYLRIREAKT